MVVVSGAILITVVKTFAFRKNLLEVAAIIIMFVWMSIVILASWNACIKKHEDNLSSFSIKYLLFFTKMTCQNFQQLTAAFATINRLVIYFSNLKNTLKKFKNSENIFKEKFKFFYFKNYNNIFQKKKKFKKKWFNLLKLVFNWRGFVIYLII